jgi:hypothetical protein
MYTVGCVPAADVESDSIPTTFTRQCEFTLALNDVILLFPFKNEIENTASCN